MFNEYNNNLNSEGKKIIDLKWDWSGMTIYNSLFDN